MMLHLVNVNEKEKDMVNLVVSTFISSGTLWLYLDNNLIMQNNDSVTTALKENTEYIVHWFAVGIPGDQYSITISSPREAQFQLTRLLVASGKDQGSFRFNA